MAADEARAPFNKGKVEKEGRTAVCLEFVSMNISSEAEKQRNQKVIRSTAMKNFRRRQQAQRTHAKEVCRTTSEIREQHLPQRIKKPYPSNGNDETVHSRQQKNIKNESSQDIQDVSFQAVDDWISQSSFHEPWNDSQVSSIDHCEGSRSSEGFPADSSPTRSTANHFFACNSPMTLLGGGRVDPFRIYPAAYVGPHVHELIDHSTEFLWPGLRPRGTNGSENKISSAWLEKVTSRPLVMHAMLFGGAVHMDVLRSPRINLNNPIRLFHKVQTMRLLKEELKNPGISDPDELILAVLALGTNEVETMMDNMKPKTRSPFNSPLSSIQWLDIYGSMSHIKAHTLAMRSLVDRRGGLEKIQLEGLAEVLEFSDILGATQSLSKPYWSLLERTAKGNTGNNSGIVYYPLKDLGQGFQALKVFGVSNTAASVLQALADLTVVIECYSRGIAPVPDLPYLIDRRNSVQHTLLSLPTADQLEFGEVSSVYLYESIRYTAVIYSIAVTFPLPPRTGIYEKLTALLISILQQSKLDLCWTLYPKTLLWVLTLGGIAASVTPNRTWFVQHLSALCAVLNISRWDDVAEQMNQFLWLERACDAGGRKLWLEVSRELCLDNELDEEEDG